jgi:hypothetical protein
MNDESGKAINPETNTTLWELGDVVFRWWKRDSYSVGSLRKRLPQSLESTVRNFVGFEVLTAMVMKGSGPRPNTWDVEPLITNNSPQGNGRYRVP